MKKKLSLVEYSNLTGVSISTLRRRIKDRSIPFTEESGKYYIIEDEGGASLENRKQLYQEALQRAGTPKLTTMEPSSLSQSQDLGFSAAARMLSELKKAYSQILQEREEQIIHLKEEISDLKTLVRVLEFENERLRK